MRELSDTEFQQTFGKTMTDIAQMEVEEPIDIWGYVKEMVNAYLVKQLVCERELVEIVYRNDQETYDHVLLPTDNENVFMVIVVDLQAREVFGHILLDLEEKYGLR